MRTDGPADVKGGDKVYHRGGEKVSHQHEEQEPHKDLSRCWKSRSGLEFVRDLGGGVLPAIPDAVAVAVHFQDVDMVSQAVQQCASQPFRPEHLGPLVEGQVGGDQDGAPLAALAEHLEEQFRAGGGQG